MLVDGDVVGVPVAAVGLEGDHHVGADAAYGADQRAHHFIRRGVDEGAWILVLRRADHAGIAVIQEEQLAHAHGLGGAAQLPFAHLAERLGSGEAGIGDLADLAARGADQGDLHAGGGVMGERAAGAEGFIIGVGKNG